MAIQVLFSAAWFIDYNGLLRCFYCLIKTRPYTIEGA